jgi:hypothetical protein
MFDLIFGYPSETVATSIVSIIGVAKAIVVLTPTPKDDVWLQRLYKVIEICALVVGRTKEGYEKPVKKDISCPNCNAEITVENKI